MDERENLPEDPQHTNSQVFELSIAAALLEAAQMLRRAGVPEARREAGSLLAHVINCDRTFLISHAEDSITHSNFEAFRECIRRRASGEPLQYITGHQEFYGLDFIVNKNVLIPRPETELMVERAATLIPQESSSLICDVGTGSGCIVVALLHTKPLARAVALDISGVALKVAIQNAMRHGVAERVIFAVSDCFASVAADARFDLIVSNPPYVAAQAFAGLQREVRDHEPSVALTPGADGLVIISRLLEGHQYLKPSGYLLMEIGFDQSAAVESLIDTNFWTLLDIQPDLQGIPRIVVLQRR